MTLAIAKTTRLPDWCRSSPQWALGLGSIAPDIPLYILSFGGIYYFKYTLNWSDEQAFQHLFDHLFFHDPIWITLHNFLHSPLMLSVLAMPAWQMRSKFPRLCRWLLFFFTACFLHSVVDILTHHDDGPLVLYPLNWSYRFSSPVSYWDPAYFGRPFMVFEGILDILLILFLVWPLKNSRQISKEITN